MSPPPLTQIVARYIVKNLLYSVDEDEKITPILKPGELNLPGSVVQHLLHQLRITRTLTNEILMLFNNCSITELSLLLELTNASPSSRSNLVNSKQHSTGNNVYNFDRNNHISNIAGEIEFLLIFFKIFLLHRVAVYD